MAAADTTFAGYAQFQDEALRAGMDNVITASLADAIPVLRVLLGLYVLLGFMLLAQNQMTALGFVRRIFRAIVVLAVINVGGIYNTHVRTMAFDTVPNAIATTVIGAGATITAAQQFDLVSQAAEALVADVRARNTGWSAAAISNGIAAWVAGGAINLANAIIAGVWLLGRKLMALVLCFGPWLIVFELFDRTRGWVDQWIGKIVGLLVFQLACTALLQIMLRGEMTMFRNLMANPNANIDEAIYSLFKVAGFIATDALAMLALPAICAIGSGVAAAQGVAMAVGMSLPSRAAGVAARTASRAGNAYGRAAARAQSRLRAST